MAVTKTIKIEVDNNFEETAEDLKGLNDELKDTAEASEEVEDATKGAAEAQALMTGGAAGKFKGLLKSLGMVIKSMFTLRGAIIATGIGALLVAITAVTQAFKGSEEGQNKLAVIMKVIGTLTENIMDLFADLGEMIIWAFENPKKAITDLANGIKKNITNRIVGLIELFPALGKAISQVFSGDFSAAAKTAANAIAKVTLGVEDFTDKVDDAMVKSREFMEEQRREAIEAGRIQEMRNDAELIERKLLVKRAELESKIAVLKLKSRQEEEFSAEERKKALIDAQALEDSLLLKEEKALKLRLAAVLAENKLARSNKEALNAAAEAEAALYNLQARRSDAARSTQRELNRVNKEIAAANKARLKVETAAREYFVEFTEKTTNEELAILTEAAKKKYLLKVKEGQELIKLYDKQDKLVQDLQEDGYEKDLAALVKLQEDRLAIAGDNEGLQQAVIDNFNLKKEELEKEHKKKLVKIDTDATKKINDNTEKVRLKKLKAADAELDIAKQGAEAIQMLGDMVFARKLAQVEKGSKEEEKLAKKQFQFNKAMQLGGAIIDAGKAVIASLASAPLAIGVAPNPIGIASLAAVGVTSALNIAKIASAKFESPGGPPDTTVPSLGGGAPPQFNVVGDSGINQLANVNQQPTQAYVVSGDVTTAQSLDRNRVQNATI